MSIKQNGLNQTNVLFWRYFKLDLISRIFFIVKLFGKLYGTINWTLYYIVQLPIYVIYKYKIIIFYKFKCLYNIGILNFVYIFK